MTNRLAKYLLCSLPNLWLIRHLVARGYESSGTVSFRGGFYRLADAGGLSEFRWFRDRFYAGYILIVALLILYNLIRKKSGGTLSGTPLPYDNTVAYIPMVIQQVILTTFSYAIAGVFLDVVQLFK